MLELELDGDAIVADSYDGRDDMVQLQTSDNEVFDAEKDVVERSLLIKTMLEDIGDSNTPIPLVNVSANVLKKVSLIPRVI